MVKGKEANKSDSRNLKQHLLISARLSSHSTFWYVWPPDAVDGLSYFRIN
jgi:hypothetical protein